MSCTLTSAAVQSLTNVEARVQSLQENAERLHGLLTDTSFQPRLVRVLADTLHHQADELAAAMREHRHQLTAVDEQDGEIYSVKPIVDGNDEDGA